MAVAVKHSNSSSNSGGGGGGGVIAVLQNHIDYLIDAPVNGVYVKGQDLAFFGHLVLTLLR